MWRDREWRFLLNLIDHLPGNSHFIQALSSDDDYAEALLAAGRLDDAESPAPSIKDWTSEVDLLALIADRLGSLIRITASARGGSATVPMVPRPVTAMARVQRRRAESKHRALVERLLPDTTGSEVSS